VSDVVVIRRESVVTIVRAAPSAPVVTERVSPIITIQRDGIPGRPGADGADGAKGDPGDSVIGDFPEVIDGGNF
jgi:hypothetical protein